jgi:hypothetical protein
MAMVRVSETAHKGLKEIATTRGVPMQTALDEAIEAYRRRVFLEGLNEDFAALRADPAAWSAEQEERALWEQTLSDGLGDE